MPERTESIAAVSRLDSENTDIWISFIQVEEDAVLFSLVCVRKCDSQNLIPIFVFILQVVCTHDYKSLYTVVVSTLSLAEVEFAVTNHIPHAGDLEVVTFETTFLVAFTIVVEGIHAFC